MRTLTAADITRVVEWGEDKHPLDRAVVLLRVALPEATRDELLRLPVGARDRLLLELRRSLFGSKLEFVVRCRPCRQPLEFAITVEQLLETPPPVDREHQLVSDRYELHFRLPDSMDLAAVVRLPTPERARAVLLRRCVSEVRLDGQTVPLGEVPAPVLEALAARISEVDPQADISFNLACDRCSAPIEAALDIVHYLWAELGAYAERIQHEIHLLASTYGWTEESILAMTAARRHRYCRMISDA